MKKQSSSEGNDRRTFIGQLLMLPALAMSDAVSAGPLTARDEIPARRRSPKLCLNAYSFNKTLLEGSLSMDEMLEFCAEEGLRGVDITGYYFKGYPKVPSDETIYQVKRRALSLGIEICGTGVRNDFTFAEAAKRKENVQLVKDWIEVAQKLGGQTLRIFSGTQKPEGYKRSQILDWMLDDIAECVAHGERHGIVVALQNHDDFIKTADETIEIMEAIRSPWFGLMLDIGSFRTADPYEEIARTIKYAVTWQVKEKVYVRGTETDVDAGRLMKLIMASDFRGYLPLETLGAGDPKEKIKALHRKFLEAMQNTSTAK